MGLGRLVDDAVERVVVGHVGDRAAHVEPLALQPGGLGRDPVAVHVDQRHAGPVGGQHLSVREPEPARATRDDGAVPADVEHQATSNRSRFITLAHAATKSWTNFSRASSLA